MQSDKESSFFLHPPCLRIQSCHLKKRLLLFLFKSIALSLLLHARLRSRGAASNRLCTGGSGNRASNPSMRRRANAISTNEASAMSPVFSKRRSVDRLIPAAWAKASWVRFSRSRSALARPASSSRTSRGLFR